jgi:hypothetical protein
MSTPMTMGISTGSAYWTTIIVARTAMIVRWTLWMWVADRVAAGDGSPAAGVASAATSFGALTCGTALLR